MYISFLNIANKACEKQKKEDELIKNVKEIFKNNPSSYDEIMSFFKQIKERKD